MLLLATAGMPAVATVEAADAIKVSVLEPMPDAGLHVVRKGIRKLPPRAGVFTTVLVEKSAPGEPGALATDAAPPPAAPLSALSPREQAKARRSVDLAERAARGWTQPAEEDAPTAPAPGASSVGGLALTHSEPGQADSLRRLEDAAAREPRALEKRPDLYAVLPRNLHRELLRRLAEPAAAAEPDLRHLALSPDGRDAVWSASCARVSGDCNPRAREPIYTKNGLVSPETLAAVATHAPAAPRPEPDWRALVAAERARLDASEKRAALKDPAALGRFLASRVRGIAAQLDAVASRLVDGAVATGFAFRALTSGASRAGGPIYQPRQTLREKGLRVTAPPAPWPYRAAEPWEHWLTAVAALLCVQLMRGLRARWAR